MPNKSQKRFFILTIFSFRQTLKLQLPWMTSYRILDPGDREDGVEGKGVENWKIEKEGEDRQRFLIALEFTFP